MKYPKKRKNITKRDEIFQKEKKDFRKRWNMWERDEILQREMKYLKKRGRIVKNNWKSYDCK
jgi:hypothetical protein